MYISDGQRLHVRMCCFWCQPVALLVALLPALLQSVLGRGGGRGGGGCSVLCTGPVVPFALVSVIKCVTCQVSSCAPGPCLWPECVALAVCFVCDDPKVLNYAQLVAELDRAGSVYVCMSTECWCAFVWVLVLLGLLLLQAKFAACLQFFRP